MANLAQENKQLREQLAELKAQLEQTAVHPTDIDVLTERAARVDELERRLADRESQLARLEQERRSLVGDIGQPPEGKTRFFSPVNNFRATFPHRKPRAETGPDGTVSYRMQPGNTAVFAQLGGPWAGSTYDTEDPQEIAHLRAVAKVSPYVFEAGPDCPKPERKPGTLPGEMDLLQVLSEVLS